MRSGSFSTTGTALPLEITHGVDLYVWGKKVGYGYTTECGHGVRGSGWSLYLSRQAACAYSQRLARLSRHGYSWLNGKMNTI